jgi:histidinol-phosphate aminotransferase
MNTVLNITDLIRPEIRQMTPYVPIKPFHILSRELGIPVEQIIKLDANENPYGYSPKAAEALAEIRADVPIYPDPASTDLRDTLAEKLGVSADQIVIGSGADELIELLFKLFVSPGETIINCPPTFGMYTFCAAVANVEEVVVERREDYTLDIEAVEAAVNQHNPKLVLICAPNNPDGRSIDQAGLERLLALNTIVVLDEAYIAFAAPEMAGEFGPENHARWVERYPNLVVLRTFSKWAGLAGLRCGYGVFAPEIASYLMTIKQPYNINVAASTAALASLDDLPILTQRVQEMIAGRDQLYATLENLTYLKAIPESTSNFVLVEVLGRSGAGFKDELAKRGILVRYFAKPRLENHIRISIGTPQQMAVLLQALEELA